MKLAQRARGFTLIELIVVIAVIGILASITVFGFSRFQEDGRDAQRSASVTTIAESLEKYFDENGEYPGCSVISAPAETVAETLPGVSPESLTTPGESTADNSLRCESLSLTGEDFFEYQGDGSEACLNGTSCLSYTLRYKEESADTIASVESRRSTDIATSGEIGNNLTVTVPSGSTGFTRLDLAWPSIPNAASYTLQRATNSGFTTDVVSVTQPSAATTYLWTGLTPGTQYYFRIQVVSTGGIGNWSISKTASTTQLATPTIATTADNLTQITVTWSAIANSTSYTLQRATNNTFTTGLVQTNPTGTSAVITGLAAGTTYYFRLQASAPNDTSDWSATATRATPQLATPTIAANANSATQITVTWSAITYATTYTLQRATNNTFTTGLVQTNPSGTSAVITGLSTGVTYYFRLQASAPADTSEWSATVSVTTLVNPPAAYSVTNSQTWNSITATSNAVCGSGTTADFIWYANGGTWLSGTQYRTVTWSNINWEQDITLTVNTRCTINGVNSGYVGGSNSAAHTSLNNPYALAHLCRIRTACWDGACPAYSTSGSITWTVRSSSFGVRSANVGLGYGEWYSGAAWGNGNVRSTTYCNGPWGTRTGGGGPGPFGAGCVPTITLAICTQ